jgi:prolyl-tRNA editing enzyme YbaK/EbsC (Cys-tRNA(Pro) deacylase)
MTYHPLVNKIKSLLKKNECWFETFEHQPVETSQQAAEIRTGYSLAQGAKALILKADKDFVMIVVPGDQRFDNQKVQQLLGTNHIRFARPEEIKKITDGVKIGGIPPFGNLFNLDLYVDQQVLGNEKIIFNAGDRKFSIAMKSKDFQHLAKPEMVDII